jgi:hypothetical protein
LAGVGHKPAAAEPEPEPLAAEPEPDAPEPPVEPSRIAVETPVAPPAATGPADDAQTAAGLSALSALSDIYGLRDDLLEALTKPEPTTVELTGPLATLGEALSLAGVDATAVQLRRVRAVLADAGWELSLTGRA